MLRRREGGEGGDDGAVVGGLKRPARFFQATSDLVLGMFREGWMAPLLGGFLLLPPKKVTSKILLKGNSYFRKSRWSEEEKDTALFQQVFCF